ncbi:MAG: NAD(P)/FAD-dependent oxidoreductase [Lachnospiraceae bacterium]|nr:NAD(P)/FAD-dependent oxidoreductase [Lachnospiraceae bacterium]
MQIIVVGGGAAGMMAALTAAGKGAQVLLLEKNEKLGKKIYITGKGRCNVTNACEMDEFEENILNGNKFLFSSLSQLDNKQMMDWLEKNGCHLKIERGNRVFPVSDHASDITAALQRGLQKAGVTIKLHTEVKDLCIEENKIVGVITQKGDKLLADKVLLATGGLSYPTTGSTGTGHNLAKRYGHTVMKCKPALTGMETIEDFSGLQGLSLKNVRVKGHLVKKKYYEGFGEMLFTHYGISGPLILSYSSYYAKHCYGEEKELSIDLKPALSEEQLDKRLLREFEENANKQFKHAFDSLLPSRLAAYMVSASGIAPEKKINEVTKEERKRMLSLLKNWTIHVSDSRGFAEAIITQGGVQVKQVNPTTMESKVISGLYFAGEVLDIDALTGGFNLQLAWSTGYAAGAHMIED